VSGQLHAPAALPPGKEKNPWYSLVRRLCGQQYDSVSRNCNSCSSQFISSFQRTSV